MYSDEDMQDLFVEAVAIGHDEGYPVQEIIASTVAVRGTCGPPSLEDEGNPMRWLVVQATGTFRMGREIVISEFKTAELTFFKAGK